MTAVNWSGTEKEIEQSSHTVTLTNDVIQKSYVVREQQYQQSKKKKQNFKNFQFFTSKFPLKHQHILVTSSIKVIPTIRSIQ